MSCPRRCEKFRCLPEVSAVESDARERRLTALPKPEANVLAAVSAVIDKHDWDVPELHLESGRLDEVFRALTDPKGIDVSSPAELPGMNKVLGGFPARIAQLFRNSFGLRVHRHLPGARRRLHLSSGRLSRSATRPICSHSSAGIHGCIWYSSRRSP